MIEHPWRIYWCCLLVFGIGVPELIALIRKQPDDTFSEFMWWLLGVHQDGSVWQMSVRQIVGAAFLLWLFVHFVFEVWRRF